MNNKFKVAILEVDNKNHVSLIYNWLKVAEVNKWEAALFTNREIYNHVSDDIKDVSYQLFLKEEGESILKFLFRTDKLLRENGFNILVILTLQTYFIQFSSVRFAGLKVGLTIHNAQTWFRGNIISKPSHCVKWLSRVIWKKRAFFFIVNSDNMKRYIDESFDISKDVFVMPFSLKRSSSLSDQQIKVVYPGKISEYRKRYDNFIRLAEENSEVEFLLLGAPDIQEGGLKVVERIRAKGLKNVRYFNTYVSSEIFKKEMASASLVFSDLKVKYRNSDFDEIYGKTKDSGISYLMFEYGLPGLLNAEFKNLDYLEKGTMYFKDYGELKDHLFKLKMPAKLITVKQELQNSTKDLTVERIAKGLLKICDISDK